MKPVRKTAARIAILGALFLPLLLAQVGGHLFADEELLRSSEVRETFRSPEFQEFLRSPEFKDFLQSEEFMSVGDVCQRWGDGPLDLAAFRAAQDDEPVRAAMACSLLKTQDDYVGMHMREIRPLFGEYTGYFFSEAQPTYLIEIAQTKEEESWQILFFNDLDRKIRKIVVHKNCCNRILSLDPPD